MRESEFHNQDRARSLRALSTKAEKILWNGIRNRKLCGLKFRRQVPIGPYIADFVCIDLKLVIELDGPTHTDNGEYDQKRTRYIESLGYRVIRFGNHQVFDSLFGVQRLIAKDCGLEFPPESRSPHPNPLPQAGEGT